MPLLYCSVLLSKETARTFVHFLVEMVILEIQIKISYLSGLYDELPLRKIYCCAGL